MERDEAEFVGRYLSGDREAIGTVDGWILRAAWPFQRRLSHRWDDVLQDVRLEITRLLTQGKFRGDSSLKTYLWRVVSHTCLDQVRAQSKWKWEDLEEVEHPIAGTPPSPSHADAGAERDLLFRVLDRVPRECRELWRMILAGLSYREMSQRTGVAEGTLRVRVLRCRETAAQARGDLLGTPPERGGNVGRRAAPKSVGGNANDL